MTSTPTDEQDLAARIDPWLAHMCWRPGFAEWRAQRIHQEHHQDEALHLLDAALRTGGRLPGQKLHLLDMGCGMGGFAVAAALRGFQVTALDYNPAYAAITTLRATRYRLQLPVLVAAGEAVPLPSASVDVVACLDVLEHVQSPARLLAELARVLRPGGVLLLTVINRFAGRDPHYHLPLINWLPRPAGEAAVWLAGRRKGGAFRDRQRLSELHYFTWGALERLAAPHGFQVIDLDAQRVARGEIGQRKRWRRWLTGGGRLALPAYHIYRTIWQGTWRVVLVKAAA
jgi:SAM-dependent methyltransferase